MHKASTTKVYHNKAGQQYPEGLSSKRKRQPAYGRFEYRHHRYDTQWMTEE